MTPLGVSALCWPLLAVGYLYGYYRGQKYSYDELKRRHRLELQALKREASEANHGN